MRLRKNVWTVENDPADDTLLWYSRAIGAMKARPINDHRSLRFQAAIHQYRRELDPLAAPADVLPSASDQATYWTQCQHSSWFFLPWHRMYLHHFESIVAAEVAALGGPADWGLPYWNYHGNAESRKVPPSFRNPSHADGTTNHLFSAQRRPGRNQGTVSADDIDIDLKCLRQPVFAGPPFGGSPGFGGPESGFQHAGGAIGELEATPHGSMHVFVGGWMANFTRTGLDPLFYCHHCNVDRLWKVWRGRDPNHKDPTSPLWLRTVRFPFRNASGGDGSMYCRDVLQTEAQLGYLYEDVSDPLGGAPDLFGIGAAMAQFPRMIGASDTSIEVRAGAPARTTISAAGRAAGESFGLTGSQRVFLHLENLTSDGPAQSIDVYIQSNDPAHRVARIPLFGIEEASRRDGPHAGSGLTFSTEVTSLVRELPDVAGRELVDIPISLEPVGEWGENRVRVGRISLYAADE